MTGRCPAGRAGRPADQAPAGLGDTATIPNADPTLAWRAAVAIYSKYEELPDYAQGQMNGLLAAELAIAALQAMREPTQAMIDAAAETPGMKAASDAMVLHQARGYGFTAGAFDDGSPLHQAWRAMIDAAVVPIIDAATAAQRIEAGTDETPKEVRPEGREPDGEADAPENKVVDPYALGGGNG